MSPDSVYEHIALKVREDENMALKYKWNKSKQSALRVPKVCSE